MSRASVWSTSSFGHRAHTLPGELSALGDHLRQCSRLSGRGFALRCGGEAVLGFVGSRIVTTLFGMALLGGAIALAW